MSIVKSLIFDFDNTIVKNTSPIDLHVLDVVKKYNKGTDEQQLLKTIRRATTNYQICQKLVPNEDIESVYKQILEINLENVKKAYYSPKIIDLILSLKDYYALHIVSGRDVFSLTYSLKEHKIDSCFVEIIGADSGFKAKPSPEALEFIINKYDFTSSQIIAIGDSHADYLAAKGAGCKFINACWYEGRDIIGDSVVSCYDIGSFMDVMKSIQSN